MVWIDFKINSDEIQNKNYIRLGLVDYLNFFIQSK